jgi:WD40 repeat protein
MNFSTCKSYLINNFFQILVVILFLVSCSISPNSTPEEISLKKPLRINQSPDEIWKEIGVTDQSLIENRETDFRPLIFENRKTERRVYQVLFSKDNKYLIAVTSFRISMYSLPDMIEVAFLEPRNIVPGGFTGVSLSYDSKELLVGSSWENTALLLDWSGNKLKKFSCKDPFAYPEDVKFSLDNKLVYVSCLQFAKDKKFLGVYKTTGEEVSFSEVKHSYLEILNNHLFTFSPREVLMKDVKSGKNTSLKFPSMIQSYAFFDEKEWVTGAEGQWTFWSMVGSNLIKKSSFLALETGFKGEDYKLDTDYRNYAALSPSGKYLLTGGVKGAYIWNRTGELKKKLSGHTRNVSAVAFSSDGNYLATASPDKIMLWIKEITETNLE